MLGVEDEFCIFIVGIPKEKEEIMRASVLCFVFSDGIVRSPLFTVVLIETLFEF